jgi:uncharacterized protein (UPF0332 family)
MIAADFIEVASKLAAQATVSPALCRTIISRAYYGAFHVANEFLIHAGKRATARHDTHTWFVSSKCDEARLVGRKLADLNSWRTKADYRLNDLSTESLVNARKAVEIAREIQTLITACEAEPKQNVLRIEIHARQQSDTSGS